METKVNSGAIFKNDKKAKETHPDYRGKVNVNGTDWELSLWLRESKTALNISALEYRSRGYRTKPRTRTKDVRH